MATQDRDRSFEPAERKDPGHPSGYPSLRVPRRLPYRTIVTVLSSALIGAAVAWLLLSPSPSRQPDRQKLAALPSVIPSPAEDATETNGDADTSETRSRDASREHDRRATKSEKTPARHTRITFEPRGGHAGAAPPPPPPASSNTETGTARTNGTKKQQAEPEQETEPEFQWPRTRLYHLYRKRDKLHYYTITSTDAQAAQSQNGFKERLSPGYVYTHNAYPKKLIPIQPYALIEPVYIFRVDQGDATFPLYRLYKSGHKQMLTSWTHIRQAWLDKGWQDRGIAGYIYRP